MEDDSKGKHFGRKFVASNMKTLLLCPKCSNTYTYSCFKNQSESHRPFLLPCGHNLCEKCIWHNRQDLKCAVCHEPAPPMLKAKNPATKSGVSVRDFYVLNYHVLGEIFSSSYFWKRSSISGMHTSTDTANNSLNASAGPSEVVQIRNCSECGLKTAPGECRKCDAFYCNRCFDMVHKHSRVLKSHVFQKFRNETPGFRPSGMRIGDEFFPVPGDVKCKHHNLLRKIRCLSCRTNLCQECPIQQHKDHNIKTLTDLNLRYASEIPVALSALDTAHNYIKNCQKTVRAAKHEQSDDASEAMATISKHFCHLHGQLQVAELQIIEKLRECSLPPQMELNEAMGKLKAFESLILKLKQILKSGLETQSRVPENVSMENFLKIIYETLEKTPSSVEIQKNKGTSYRFITNSIDLTNTLNFTFVDPNIRVEFDFHRSHRLPIGMGDKSFSQSSVSEKENVRHFFGKPQSQRSMTPQNLRGKTSKGYQSSRFSVSQPNDRYIVNNFSALDIANLPASSSRNIQDFFNKGSSTSSSRNDDWLKPGSSVKLLFIKSPEDFYLQDVEGAHKVRDELERYAQRLDDNSSSAPSVIEMGQKYLTYHQDKDCFYRSVVIMKLAGRDTSKVYLPDMGFDLEVDNSNFHNLPKSLAHIDYAAARCRLKDLAPKDEASKWDSGATEFLKLVVQNPVKLHEIRRISSDFYEVDLRVKNNTMDISVRESFLYAGLARSRTGKGSVTGRIAPQRLQLQKYPLQYRDLFMVQMQHVEHPQEFYITHHNWEVQRSRHSTDLNEFMRRMDNIQLENLFLGLVHLACAVQLDGVWKRARVEKILSAGYVMIRLVDEGHAKKVYWDQLFVLPQNFWSSEAAIRCCLADVETRPKTDYMWTPEAINYFKQLTSNPKLYVDVLHYSDDLAYVALTYTRSVEGESTTMSVGVQMVAMGHCTSSGESSKAIRPSNVARSPGLDADTRRFLDQQKKKAKAVELTPFQRPDEKERNKRIVVNIVYVRKPDEFYLTLPHFQPAIEELKKTVQAAAAAMYRDQVPKTNWQIGDMCYVKVLAQSDQDLLWHRGLVTKVFTPEFESQLPRYQVQLRDLGEQVENVSSTCMANIDEGNMRISNSAKRCHLYGIRPPGNGWSANAIEFFEDQIRAYNHNLHVTGRGHSENSLSVILWGARTEIPGPFSPARTTFVNINKTIVLAGFAIEDHDTDESMQDIASIDPSVASTDTSDIKAMQNLMDKIDNKVVVNNHETVDSPRPYGGFQHNEEMPPMELLQDLGKSKPSTGQKVPPVAWTTPRPCKKTIFAGIASNVSYEGNVYLGLASDKTFLEHMRGLLIKEYLGMMEKQHERSTSFSYEVGQPVLVSYHMDNLLYRGIVQRQNQNEQYTVYYVDYGNMEQVSAYEMLPYAPFPKLHAMCWKVSVHGVKPKNVKYSVKEMDTLHQQVVMKLSSIRVIERSDGESNKIPSCQIKVNNQDIATFMIECGMAVAVDTDALRPNSTYMPSKKALEEFKVFEELDNLAAGIDSVIVKKGKPAQRKDESVSTARPPPPKKKYVVNRREVDLFESDQDFDCQEAALEMYNNINIPHRRMNNFIPDSDSDSDEDEDSVSLNDEDDRDVVVEEEFTNVSDSEINPTNVQSVDIVSNQLKRRIELHQEDMSQQACFSPMDTSTVRSLYQAGSSFKTLHLPTGVKQFMCTVDNVLSATELQISPRLSEFTKHDINLLHETSALISMSEPLIPKLGDLCLARYSKDKKWYRGTIEEVQPGTNQATVFYIDFHDTESVPYSHLKVMPEQLRMFPLRSFRVKLHNIKMNRNFKGKTVVQALKACLCKYTDIFARVHYPKNYHANRSDCSDEGYDQIEVDLFESKNKKKLLYQALIDSWMFIKKANK
ncbi:uncharacterized protein qin isoform X2 [Drosophila bipectinata]|uniref:uncharacterized protein qin isoform X2 n=1 Tax=Drosophila bipectinata TaxID=42026 RepID=UPI0038B3D02D